MAEYEGYYASVLYAFFAAIDGEIIPEDISNRGQADLTVKLGDNIYVMEIKAAASAAVGTSGVAAADARAASGGATSTDTGKSGTGAVTSAVAASGTESPRNPALEQIRKKAYADKYTGLPGKNIYEVGIIFDPEERNLAAIDWMKR